MNNYILKLSDFGFWDEEKNKYHTLDADNQRMITLSANGNSFRFDENVRVKGLSLDDNSGAILFFNPIDENHFEIRSSNTSNIILDMFKNSSLTMNMATNSSLTMNMATTTANIPGFILNCGIGFTVTAQNFQLYSPYGRIQVGDGKNGKACITGVKDGVNDNDAVNVSQLNSKQDKFATVSYESSPRYLSLSINGYVDPNSGKFIQLSPSDITATHIDITNADFLNKVKFNQSLIMGSSAILGFDFELPTATIPGKIKTGNPNINKLNFSNGLGNSDIQLGGIKTPTADNDAANKKYVDDSIATQVSSVYKAKGSIADISALPTPDKAHEGFVYNIENEFTTTDQFVEGAGKTYPAGTNVVCVNTTSTTYKWDVLAGMVDLSNYATKTELSGKLDKQTSTGTFIRTYTVNKTGSNEMMDMSTGADASTVAIRTLTGSLRVATPVDNNDAATKKYVDDAIGNINSILATMFNDVSTQSDEEPTNEEVIA